MSSPDLTDLERQAVLAVLRTPRLSMGPQIEAFESAVAKEVGARHAIGVSSGTAGLHIAIRLAGVRDGDLVLTSPFSFVASANVMLYERAVPLFVDVDPETGNLDMRLATQAVEALAQGAGGWRGLPAARRRSRGDAAGPASGRCLRSAGRLRSAARGGAAGASAGDRGFVRSLRRQLQRPAGGPARGHRCVRVLSQQADDDR